MKLRIYDSSGALVRSLDGGASAAAVVSFSASPQPWDPSSGPLSLSDGSWSAAFDGKDSGGNYLPNGNYVVEAESSGSAVSLKTRLTITLIRSSTGLVSAIAWPNPASKSSAFIMISWAPAALEVEGKIYNQAGELVLDLGLLKGGIVRWELKNASDGVYMVALRVPGERHPRLIKVALAR